MPCKTTVMAKTLYAEDVADLVAASTKVTSCTMSDPVGIAVFSTGEAVRYETEVALVVA